MIILLFCIDIILFICLALMMIVTFKLLRLRRKLKKLSEVSARAKYIEKELRRLLK